MNLGDDLGKGLNKFGDKTAKRADNLKRAVGLKLFGAIIRDSPVGDPDYWKSPAPKGYTGGRFRANWNCSLHAPDLSTTESTNKAVAVQRMQTVVLGGDRETVDFLSNGLPYAMRLEQGYSRQAPFGMVGKNVIRFRRLVSEQLKKMK